MTIRMVLSGSLHAALRIAAITLALAGGLQGAEAYRLVPLAERFDTPVQVTGAPGESDLLFVVETPGRVQVLQNGKRLPQPYLDISRFVLGQPDAGAGGEQGLLSIAFAPDYQKTGLFYVAYTNARGDVEIDEFSRAVASRFRADVASRRSVLVVPHRDAQNHNGGQLQFGPENALYISIGDGGATPERAPNLNSLLGKILRIVPTRQASGAAYRVPPSNPFVGAPGRDEIFAYGLRNPWRFSFDGNRLIVADVGQSTAEEVNFLTAGKATGANFGWPEYEAFKPYDDSHPGPDDPTFPIFAYDHADGKCSIIGGYVVHDPGLPNLAGKYLFGDYCTGKISALTANVGAQKAKTTNLGVVAPQLSGFGVGPDRQIYVVRLDGTIARLERSTGD